MRGRVRINGALKKPGGLGELEVELAPGAVVTTLLGHLGYDEGHHRFILAAVNGEQAQHSRALADAASAGRDSPTDGLRSIHLDGVSTGQHARERWDDRSVREPDEWV